MKEKAKQLIADTMVCTQEFAENHPVYRHTPFTAEVPRWRKELHNRMGALAGIIIKGREANSSTTHQEQELSVLKVMVRQPKSASLI